MIKTKKKINTNHVFYLNILNGLCMYRENLTIRCKRRLRLKVLLNNSKNVYIYIYIYILTSIKKSYNH